MTFDSLANQTGIVYRKADNYATNPAGMPTGAVSSTAIATTAGRMRRLGARQIAMWESLGIEAEYEWISKSMVIQNGDVIVVTDQFGRAYGTFRVVGGAFPYVGEGSIESFCNFPLKQDNRTGLTS